MSGAVVLMSGGMDSTTLAYYMRRELQSGEPVHGISIHYGQRHSRELKQARIIAQRLAIPHYEVDLRALRYVLGGSALTSDDVEVPHGHYAADAMKQTVVSNRNMILLSVAAGYAGSRGLSIVAYAAHGGDHHIYPDCRPGFVNALAEALHHGMDGKIRLVAPFIDQDKTYIARLGDELGVPWEETWSCYEGGAVHCGKCGTCVERMEAFTLAGVRDPSPYAL